jgi:hypothetical protein
MLLSAPDDSAWDAIWLTVFRRGSGPELPCAAGTVLPRRLLCCGVVRGTWLRASLCCALNELQLCLMSLRCSSAIHLLTFCPTRLVLLELEAKAITDTSAFS